MQAQRSSVDAQREASQRYAAALTSLRDSLESPEAQTMLDRGLDLVDRSMRPNGQIDPSEWPVVHSALLKALSAEPGEQALDLLEAFVEASTIQSGKGPIYGTLDIAALGTLEASVEETLPNIFRLDFADNESMCELFLRFQEHYESPKYHHQHFHLPEYKEWYAAQNDGKFTYYEDWGGFNIPSWVFTAFREGHLDPLSDKERALLKLFENIDRPFYVIGTSGPSALDHELAHGLFTTHREYRREVLRILAPLDLAPLRTVLLGYGYAEHTVIDEVHAYFRDGGGTFADEGVDMAPYSEAVEKIQALYVRYKAKGERKLGIKKQLGLD